MKLGDGTISEFQRKKASGTMSKDFLLTHREHGCHCLVQRFWYLKRANLILVWETGKLFFMGLPDQTQNVTILVVSAMLAVRWLEANAGTTEQEMAVPTQSN